MGSRTTASRSRAATATLIQGNYIGTDTTGTVADPNSDDGITIDTTSYDTIGGTTAADEQHHLGQRRQGDPLHLRHEHRQPGRGELHRHRRHRHPAAGQPRQRHRHVRERDEHHDRRHGRRRGERDRGQQRPGHRDLRRRGAEHPHPGELHRHRRHGHRGPGQRPVGHQLRIGGETILDNVISGNNSGGIQAYGSGTVIQGNDIGTDPSGTLNLGNLGPGVEDSGSDIQVGGLGPGQGNVIAFNGNIWYGPLVRRERRLRPDERLDPEQLDLRQRRLGIDLNNDGVTPNHPGGPVSGRTTIRTTRSSSDALTYGGSTIIIGTLQSAANSTYTLQFFDNPTADPSGHGQGQTLIGTTTVTTDSSGNASFQVTFSARSTPAMPSPPRRPTRRRHLEFAQDVAAVALPRAGGQQRQLQHRRQHDAERPLPASRPMTSRFTAGRSRRELVSSTSHGSLTFNSDGSFTYVPDRATPGTHCLP